MYLDRSAKPPPPNNYVINKYSRGGKEAASKSVLTIHSIYEKLSNELPTYQLLANDVSK